MGFPEVSADKESACNAGDTGDVCSIPGLGRSPGGGNDHPLQHSWLGRQRILVCYRPQHYKESDMTEHAQAQGHTMYLIMCIIHT